MYIGKRAKWSLSWSLNKRDEKNVLGAVNVMFSFIRFTEADIL